MTLPFAQRLRALQRQHPPFCLGLDPHPHAWPPFLQAELNKQGLVATIARWGHSLIEVAATSLGAVKIQSAMFEALGAEGLRLMKELCTQARAHQLFVICDAKRGDIASTMASYGSLAFDYLQADALTVVPYLGFDVLRALKPWLGRGHGAYVVWLSSNAEGALLQNFAPAGQTFAAFLLEHFFARSAAEGLDSGWGLVVGANQLEQIPEGLWPSLLELPLLLPGLGAQGASPSLPRWQQLSAQGSALFPLSRALTGVGYPEQQELWARCTTFADYQNVVKQQITLWLSRHKNTAVVS